MDTLFDDILKVTSVETGRYDRVARITAVSNASQDIHLTLDVNTEIFPIAKGDNLTVAIAQSIGVTGSWKPTHEPSLADDYDYVMYGTVYKFEETANDKVSMYTSFGGLIMCLEGSYRKLSNLKLDNVYLLIRK